MFIYLSTIHYDSAPRPQNSCFAHPNLHRIKTWPKKCSRFKAPSGRCIVLFLTRDLGFVICVVYFTLLFSLIMCAGKECKSISPRTTTSYLKMTRMNLNGIQIARPQIKQTKQMNPNGSKDLQSKARAPKRSLKF